ncbi:MAG: SDR family oxidoreductase [Clostridia bacterium]|nr:SDR family oxidoreductase [Clostridia bacterium]
MKLRNKTVIVTAATRGIGLACARACAAEGGRVYLAARNMDTAQARAKELCDAGFCVKAVYNDAGKPESFRSMAQFVAEDAGSIDVLINNFGTSDPKTDRTLRNTDTEDFLRTVELNLRSVFAGTQAVLPFMTKGGSIVNISSVSSIVPDISQVAYGTSKAAINYLTKLIAVQEARRNIRCNAVLPGMTATEAVSQHLSPTFRDAFLRHTPLGRMGYPEEIAAAAVFFASDESSYATGQILALSGGFGLATPLYGDFADAQTQR